MSLIHCLSDEIARLVESVSPALVHVRALNSGRPASVADLHRGLGVDAIGARLEIDDLRDGQRQRARIRPLERVRG